MLTSNGELLVEETLENFCPSSKDRVLRPETQTKTTFKLLIVPYAKIISHLNAFRSDQKEHVLLDRF